MKEIYETIITIGGLIIFLISGTLVTMSVALFFIDMVRQNLREAKERSNYKLVRSFSTSEVRMIMEGMYKKNQSIDYNYFLNYFGIANLNEKETKELVETLLRDSALSKNKDITFFTTITIK